MMGTTKIEWAERTWNPVTGCTPISEGCQNCYAERMSKRLAGRAGYPAEEPFQVTLHPDRLEEPLRWRKARKVFVCSMSDLFHDDVPDDFIEKVFNVMDRCGAEHNATGNRGHIFMVLTKRPHRMKAFVDRWWRSFQAHGVEPYMERIWLGVTAENQDQADKRIPILLQIPAAVKFVSVEPMLGRLTLDDYINAYYPGPLGDGISWVICGGETGPGARPMHPDWVRSLRDQCEEAGVPFFFKQWGEWAQMDTPGYIGNQENL